MFTFTAKKIRKARVVTVDRNGAPVVGRIRSVSGGLVSFIRIDTGAVDYAKVSEIRSCQ